MLNIKVSETTQFSLVHRTPYEMVKHNTCKND